MLETLKAILDTKEFNNLLHAALLVVSIYVSQDPHLAPYAPAIQALGQGINPPK